MIIDGIINFIFTILQTIIGALPIGGGLPTEVHTAGTFFGNYLAILDPLVPISTLGTIIGLIITFELALFAFKTIKWLISYIPFVGGRG